MLRKKLFRTMGRYKAQFISMVIMIALGVGVFLGFNMEWYTLEKDVDKALTGTGFADFRVISETGFSEEELEAVLALEGVKDAARFLSVQTTVTDDADLIALAVTSNPAVSGVRVLEGAPYDAEARGLWLSDQYAAKNDLRVGDRLSLSWRGLTIEGEILGLIKAGEFLICLPDETQLMPDYSSGGFAYMSPAMLREVLGAEFYTQINVRSERSKADFVAAAEKALGRTTVILSKEENVSWAESRGEMEEGKTMGSILPVLFLAIAILTMVTTMHRLTASEKTQIGLLKSLGFRDRRILWHYTSYALAIGVLGTVPGIALGWWLCWFIMNPGGAMGTYIDMADWTLYVPSFCWFVIAGINVFLTTIGWLSVKSMLRGTAADALRPYTPRKMKPLLLERTRLWDRLGFSARWNLRDSLRHKSRTGMTLFGIVGCMVLLVGALGMNDTAGAFVRVFFDEATAYENKVNLAADALTNEEALSLAGELEGDWSALSSVQLGDKAVALEIYHVERDLLRFVDGDMNEVTLAEEGVYVCERIARDYGLTPGDELTFSPYGSSESYTARVNGVLRSMTESIVLTDKAAEKLGFPYAINTVYTTRRDIPARETVSSVQSKKSLLDSFDAFMELMITMIIMLVIAAVILGIVVLYNLGVMSYTERYREMATLKVVGFRDRQIGRILIGQNLWLTVLGVAIGLPAGVGVLQYLITALASEYEMKLTLGPLTWVVSTALTFGVSLIVGWMIARKNRKINMVEALKGVD